MPRNDGHLRCQHRWGVDVGWGGMVLVYHAYTIIHIRLQFCEFIYFTANNLSIWDIHIHICVSIDMYIHNYISNYSTY